MVKPMARKRHPSPSSSPLKGEEFLKKLPWILIGLFLLHLLLALRLPSARRGFDVSGFGQLPVLSGGRVKPIDTVARTSLLLLRGKQTVPAGERKLPATEWLLDVLYQPPKANAYPVFEIDDPDVLGLMGLEQTKNRHYPFDTLRPHLQNIENQAAQAEQTKAGERTRFQTSILNLQHRVVLYQKLQNTLQLSGHDRVQEEYRHFAEHLAPALAAHVRRAKTRVALEELAEAIARYRFMDQVAEFYPLPGPRGMKKMDWGSLGGGVLDAMTNVRLRPGVLAYAAMGDAYRAGDASAFNRALKDYKDWLMSQVPGETNKAAVELRFNHLEPFYQSMVIYVAVFLLTVLSLLCWPRTLARSAWMLLGLAFAVHTMGLFSRMVLQGRPPVTNLYSSAIFVGWVAVLLGIVLERIYRNGIGSAVASVIGFLTLIIAHHLTSQGDTLEMMRAVLDSNFWLATHVTTITIGYSATFLSGFLATLYLARRLWDPRWNEGTAQALERMTYGVVCFALLFSFIGTILGGIWADQSWGRFWGWDPKENGALMIVLWNTLILHARVGNFVKPAGLMILAVFGNIVTAFSWFGVNMLGIGLHSYGFMDKAFVWLVIFSASQLAVMGLGFLPRAKGR